MDKHNLIIVISYFKKELVIIHQSLLKYSFNVNIQKLTFIGKFMQVLKGFLNRFDHQKKEYKQLFDRLNLDEQSLKTVEDLLIVVLEQNFGEYGLKLLIRDINTINIPFETPNHGAYAFTPYKVI